MLLARRLQVQLEYLAEFNIPLGLEVRIPRLPRSMYMSTRPGWLCLRCTSHTHLRMHRSVLGPNPDTQTNQTFKNGL